MRRNIQLLVLSGLVIVALFLPGSVRQAEAGSKKKTGFFTKITRKVKRKVKSTAKKVRRNVVKNSAAVTDAVMDGALDAKAQITGKKKKQTHVKGHYKKGNRKHTKGHLRKTSRKKKSSSGGSGSAPTPERELHYL